MIGPQRQSQSPNSRGDAPFGNVGSSAFPPPPPPEASQDAGIGATPIVPCPCTPAWGSPSWSRSWRPGSTASSPCRARPGRSSPCKARSWGGRSPCKARSRWGRSPCEARARGGRSSCKARSPWRRSPCTARSPWSGSPCKARSPPRSPPLACRARPRPGRSSNNCRARSWADTSPRPPCRARSSPDKRLAAAWDTSDANPVFPSKPPFQYPDCWNTVGTETLFSAVLRDWTSRSSHICFASLAVITSSPAFWPLWGFHNLSPFFTCGFDSHVSYKLLTKPVPSTSGSPAAVGNGGIGGNIGSSLGGGPSGTLVPFGVNRNKPPFSQASGLTARPRVLGLGVLLPPLPWRSAWKIPFPPEPSTEVPSTTDHGEEASPEPAFAVPLCSCPFLRDSNSCISFTFWFLKNFTSSPSRARCRPSLFSSIPLFPADLTWPCDKTGSSHPGIRPSVLIAPDPCSVGSGVHEPSPAPPPRPFPEGSASAFWDWEVSPDAAWHGCPLKPPSTGSAWGLAASSLHSSWIFWDQNGLLSAEPLKGTDCALSMAPKKAQ